MKTIFFGSSDYCLPILKAIDSNFQLTAVVTKQNTASKSFAQSHNMKVFTPKDKSELLQLISQIRQIRPDLVIVADYGLIIQKEIFSIPQYKTLNIHFSKLPKFRGPSPVQYTILTGEKSAWISVIRMDEGLDTGDIVWQKEIPLKKNQSTNQLIIQSTNYPITETTEYLYKKLFNIIASELPDIINKYVNGKLIPIKQDNSLATYTKHFNRSDGFIPGTIINHALQGLSIDQKQLKDWPLTNTVPQLSIINYQLSITRACRALSPWPGLWTEIKLPNKIMTNSSDRLHLSSSTKKRLKILKAHLEPIASQGQPLRGYKLILEQVQLEGKKPVSWKQFTEGYPDFTFSQNTSSTN